MDNNTLRQFMASLNTMEREIQNMRRVVEAGLRAGEHRPGHRRNPQPVGYGTDEETIQAVLALSLNEAIEDANRPVVSGPIRLPKLKTKAIKAAEINAPMPADCAICQETHNRGDSIETSCGHHFGQECFLQWVTTKKSRRQDVTCPLCLTTDMTYHGFRARKAAAVRRDPVERPLQGIQGSS